jgi:hypothetical protein
MKWLGCNPIFSYCQSSSLSFHSHASTLYDTYRTKRTSTGNQQKRDTEYVENLPDVSRNDIDVRNIQAWSISTPNQKGITTLNYFRLVYSLVWKTQRGGIWYTYVERLRGCKPQDRFREVIL